MQQTSATTYPFVKATLPLPPGVNDSYQVVEVPARRAFRKGCVVDGPALFEAQRKVHRLGATEELKHFKEQAAWMLKDRLCATIDWDFIKTIKARKDHLPLCITITFYFSTLWRRDIDGGEKAAIDAIFTHIGLNDNLITEKHTYKYEDKGNPRVEVELSTGR